MLTLFQLEEAEQVLKKASSKDPRMQHVLAQVVCDTLVFAYDVHEFSVLQNYRRGDYAGSAEVYEKLLHLEEVRTQVQVLNMDREQN